MSLILHAILGLAGVFGSVMMGTRFQAEKENLSALTKIGMVLSYIGIMASAILGLASATGNNVFAIGGLSLAAIAYGVQAFARPAAKDPSMER